MSDPLLLRSSLGIALLLHLGLGTGQAGAASSERGFGSGHLNPDPVEAFTLSAPRAGGLLTVPKPSAILLLVGGFSALALALHHRRSTSVLA